MTLTIAGLKEVLAEGPGKEREHQKQGQDVIDACRAMVDDAPGDLRLQMILRLTEKQVQQVERADQLELLLLALGIQSLERIERLEGHLEVG